MNSLLIPFSDAPANLAIGISWSCTFKEPGTGTDLCGYQAEMIGPVIVES